MDAGGLYLRLFLKAKPFLSPNLDSLAETMGVSGHLSSDLGERYFLTKTNMAALSFGNKVLFGEKFYSNLTDGQRRAVTAHEFGHVLEDGGERKKRLVAPAIAVSLLMAFAVSIASGSLVLLMLASVLGFVAAAALLSSLDSDHYLRHEMRCDRMAASFANGRALVEAIHVAESLQGSSTKGFARLWRRLGVNPATKLRIDALLSYSPAN